MRTTRLHPNHRGEAVARGYLEIIRAARVAAGLSQSEAGQRIDMDRANWGVVERGVTASPGLDKVARMAEAVGLRLVLIPAEDAPLNTEELRALARLAGWYASRSKCRTLPAALVSAIRKLAPYALNLTKGE